jgi:hypothetical protein
VLATGATGYIGGRLVPKSLETGRLMRLRFHVVVPGEAWLQFEAQPLPEGQTRLVQTILMAPKGLLGFRYWYGLYPFHGLIFRNLIRAITDVPKPGRPKMGQQHLLPR